MRPTEEKAKNRRLQDGNTISSRVRSRSCGAAEYGEILKSSFSDLQRRLTLQTFSFSTGSEFLRPKYSV